MIYYSRTLVRQGANTGTTSITKVAEGHLFQESNYTEDPCLKGIRKANQKPIAFYKATLAALIVAIVLIMGACVSAGKIPSYEFGLPEGSADLSTYVYVQEYLVLASIDG